jgi:hypothetical protein
VGGGDEDDEEEGGRTGTKGTGDREREQGMRWEGEKSGVY